MQEPNSLAGSLANIEQATLKDIPPAQAAKVLRRIVGKVSLAPKLDVAAFNSAP